MFKSEFVSCKPISSLDDLLNWPFETNKKIGCRQFKVERLPAFASKIPNKRGRKFLVCHDMRNNYLEDKYFQGYNEPNSYSFYHWNLIDTFIYFSHHLITIPTESWINAAHENNVRILGTFITEFDDGEKICEQFLSDISKIDEVVNKLVNVTVFYGFDGWLINIENKVNNVENLKYFVRKLTSSLKEINPDLYQVIWYDSVIDTGELKWQNELNNLNKDFFDLCDGFFVNYTWTESNLANTKFIAGNRMHDVYVGIDVFGRGCLGDGGFNCIEPLKKIVEYDLSVALFAPGWVHECLDVNNFYANNDKFWKLLEPSLEPRLLPEELPLITTFTHASSKNFFLNGQTFLNSNWFNLNLQSLMPILSNQNAEWCFDDAYYGGNSVLISPKGLVKLFHMNVHLKSNKNYLIEYAFKEGETQEFNDEEFYLNLVYIIEKSNQENTLKLIEKANENFIQNCDSTVNECGWKTRRIIICVEHDWKVVSIEAVNKSSASYVKLGIIRLLEKNQTIQMPISPQIAYNTTLFYLDKRIYICIDLNWSFTLDNFKYCNVFVNGVRNQNRAGKSQESANSLRYVGSTKSNSFKICLKLNEKYQLDSSTFSNKETLLFDLYIHFIDKYLNNLKDAEKFFLLGENSTNLTSSISKICIKVPGVKASCDKVEQFINDLIYDFESFKPQ
jgi:mannosyl-glycoprotein endo-beta-N-acetylglucosaminidase